MAKSVLVRFQEKYTVDPETGCWLWKACIAPNGYGLFHDGKLMGAHRFSYMFHIGNIPTDFDLDHLCRVRRCVNPNHLEAVPHSENVRRGLSPSIIVRANAERQKARTHCPKGHEYTAENIYVQISKRDGNYRVCKTCRKASYEKSNARQREHKREAQ